MVAVDEFLRSPLGASIVYLILSLALWRAAPRRYRVVALCPLSGPLLAAGAPVIDWLRGFEFGWVGQVVISFGVLTTLLAGFALAVDRYLRDQLDARLAQLRVSPYVVPVFVGLGATLTSLGALYWVTSVSPEIRGSFELALLGGSATACLGLIRVDRDVDRMRSSRDAV